MILSYKSFADEKFPVACKYSPYERAALPTKVQYNFASYQYMKGRNFSIWSLKGEYNIASDHTFLNFTLL